MELCFDEIFIDLSPIIYIYKCFSEKQHLSYHVFSIVFIHFLSSFMEDILKSSTQTHHLTVNTLYKILELVNFLLNS